MIVARYKGFTCLFVALSAIYIALSALLPPDKTSLVKYKISAGQAVALALVIIIPYVIIWFIALVGYLRLRSYTDTIASSKDGRAFRLVERGILLLSLWLPTSAIIDNLARWYTRVHPSSATLMASLSNYSTILILFLAFLSINLGSKKLLSVVNKKELSLPPPLMILFISFTTFYTFLVLHDPARQMPTSSVNTATYYLPDWLIITTIVIPRIIMWFLGIQAVNNLYLYRRTIKGPIYKQALDSLAKGIAWVVVTVIVLRCYQSLSTQLSHFSLGLLVLIIYGLLILISVGYVLISKGAKNLQRIEEV